jgi:putative transposase
MRTFFEPGDYAEYIGLMAEFCAKQGVEIWAYCLMPNHVHLIATPSSEDGLRRGIGEAHRRYTRFINLRKKWVGHLWQERFASNPLDEEYLLAATRFVELNPVRARLVNRPEQYRWSSARAHLAGKNDKLVKVAPLLKRVGDWKPFLSSGLGRMEAAAIRRHERTGRPLGSEAFVVRLEHSLDRRLRPHKPGPKTGSKR